MKTLKKALIAALLINIVFLAPLSAISQWTNPITWIFTQWNQQTPAVQKTAIGGSIVAACLGLGCMAYKYYNKVTVKQLFHEYRHTRKLKLVAPAQTRSIKKMSKYQSDIIDSLQRHFLEDNHILLKSELPHEHALKRIVRIASTVEDHTYKRLLHKILNTMTNNNQTLFDRYDALMNNDTLYKESPDKHAQQCSDLQSLIYTAVRQEI